MTWEEYLRESARFENKELTKHDLEDNAIFGLVGEFGELCDLYKKIWFHGHPEDREHILKECGDVLWYLALYCRCRGLTISTYGELQYSSVKIALTLAMYRLLQLLSPDGADEMTAARDLYRDIDFVIRCNGSSIEEVLDMNIAKLSARYPDGFSTEASLYRAEGDI